MRMRTTQSGFTLFEVLLVIGIAALLILGVAQIARNWANMDAAKGAGQHLQAVAAITEKFMADNMPALSTATTPIQDVLLETGLPWTNLQTALSDAGLYTPADGVRSPLGVALKIGFQRETVSPDTFYRLIIYSTTPIANQKLLAAARQGGPFAGVWMNFPTAAEARGAFGQWRLANSIVAGGTLPLISATPTTTQGYLVTLIERTDKRAAGTYLYREAVSGVPEANQMATDLDMNGNDITNADTINATNMNVTGTSTAVDMNVTGTSNFANNVTTDDMNVGGALTVGGASTFNAPLTVNGPVDLGGNSLSAGTVQSANCMQVGGNKYDSATPAGAPGSCP